MAFCVAQLPGSAVTVKPQLRSSSKSGLRRVPARRARGACTTVRAAFSKDWSLQGVPQDDEIAGTFVTHLECSLTGEKYTSDELHGLADSGKPLLVKYDLEALKGKLTRETLAARAPTMWKWRELLPVRAAANCVTLGEWCTPIVDFPVLGALNGMADGGAILVKDEGRLPTGSFKARGLVMAISMAKELGVKRMAMPTNGNAGAAMSAYCTRCGIETFIFAPEVGQLYELNPVDP